MFNKYEEFLGQVRGKIVPKLLYNVERTKILIMNEFLELQTDQIVSFVKKYKNIFRVDYVLIISYDLIPKKCLVFISYERYFFCLFSSM